MPGLTKASRVGQDFNNRTSWRCEHAGASWEPQVKVHTEASYPDFAFGLV